MKSASLKRDRKVVCCATHLNKYPYFMVKNGEFNEDKVDISFFPVKHGKGISLTVDRSIARLLAKRINQFLDFTAKK